MECDAVSLAVEPWNFGPYDAKWASWFERERAALLALVPDLVEVEHIGSTAVPGLEAKPIIDMQAALRALNDSNRVIPRLIELGYTYMAERVFIVRVLADHP